MSNRKKSSEPLPSLAELERDLARFNAVSLYGGPKQLAAYLNELKEQRRNRLRRLGIVESNDRPKRSAKRKT
jgi:hypothetical protein